MNFHLGPTTYPGCLRFHHGTISAKWDGEERKQEVYFEHPIKRWYGISFGHIFIGFIRTDRTRDVREGSISRGQTARETP